MKTLKGNKILSNGAGFTLIELLVSVFIVGMVSSVFMVNYHSTNKRSELKLTTQKLVSDIRLAQNYSLGSRTVNGVSAPSGGWGVRFSLADPAHYLIFADQNFDWAYTAGADAVEVRALPAGVTLDYLDGNNIVDIVFFPPDPAVIINGSYGSSASIRLKENINNSTAEVTVNSFGLIDAN